MADVHAGHAGHADSARRAAERVARESYGRIVAWLAWQWRDLAAAEDALADALLAALTTWPATGVPDSPEAWLMTAAKRNLLQAHRHRGVVDTHAVRERLEHDAPSTVDAPALPDERLRLLFVCAHPQIEPAARTPLMLQAVFGLDAARIGSAFLVAPATMAQRLVRSKARIRDAGLRFEEPELPELPARLHAVLEAIYAAYGTGWDARFAVPASATGATDADDGFTAEALYLAALLVRLLPESAEAQGLLALLMFCEARRPAQLDASGRFVPLMQQDTRRWDLDQVRAADALLWRAAAARTPGPFQLEAAIQSAHCQRAFGGATPWPAIANLYDALSGIAPGIGTAVGRAVAVGESGDVARGVALLDALPAREVASYQPYWVSRAHLLEAAGRHDEARACYERALGLTAQRSLAAHLRARQAALPPD
jgi:RNA polymerase sigma-70 factor (ECF subfamily)